MVLFSIIGSKIGKLRGLYRKNWLAFRRGGTGTHPAPFQTARPSLEWLEDRLALSSPTVTLDASRMEYGQQILTVTQFGDSNRVALGVLDTGAAPITVSPSDQASFATRKGIPDPIPVKVAGTATAAAGLGGGVTGDVSKPITVLTDGLHAGKLSFTKDNSSFSVTAHFTSTSDRVAGIQTFIGTANGSPNLPTVSGMPIFAGGLWGGSWNKVAARIDLIHGVKVAALGLMVPDLHFVAPTTRLTPARGEQVATIPLTTLGSNTIKKPGNGVSFYSNFAASTVQLTSGPYTASNQKFLLDTGSQITVISTAEANALHLDLSHPLDSIDVQGAGGDQTINCYLLDSLSLGLVGEATLTIKNVPVFVMDTAPGQVDGVLGMNLWTNVDQMLIDPFTRVGKTTIPTLSISWNPNFRASSGTGSSGSPHSDFLLASPTGTPSLHDLLGDAAAGFQAPTGQLTPPALVLGAPQPPLASPRLVAAILNSPATPLPGTPFALTNPRAVGIAACQLAPTVPFLHTPTPETLLRSPGHSSDPGPIDSAWETLRFWGPGSG